MTTTDMENVDPQTLPTCAADFGACNANYTFTTEGTFGLTAASDSTGFEVGAMFKMDAGEVTKVADAPVQDTGEAPAQKVEHAADYTA